MKSFAVLALAALSAATPVTLHQDGPDYKLNVLKTSAANDTEHEFTQGGCRDVILIFARGSTQDGNIGGTVGPALVDQVKQLYGDARVAAEGVDYPATLLANLYPGGAEPQDADTMRKLIELAASTCPNAKLIVSGYSQGAALTHRSVEKLSQPILDRINVIVTFGDTQKKQDNNQVPHYPPEKTDIICNDQDEVCKGTLIIKPAHTDYVRRVPEGVAFIGSKIKL